MRKTIGLWLPLILIAVASMACSGLSSKKTPKQGTRLPATLDLQATIDAAVVSTCGARAGLPATESSLNATATAIAIAELQFVATPMPPEAAENMAEDKLEALIAERVDAAAKAASLAAEKAVEAVKDGAINAKEQEILYTYWYYAGEVITYSNEVIVAYYDIYGELVAGTLAPLKAIDADLQTVTQQIQVVLPLLDQIGLALEQGLGQKDKVLQQIATAAEQIQAKAADAQKQMPAWTASLQPAAQKRIEKALSVKPKGVAKNRKAAINKANEYVNSVQAAFTDQKITQVELAKIAQLGANASASLAKKGGAEFADLAGSVNEITTQIASGQLPEAQASLKTFQNALLEKPR